MRSFIIALALAACTPSPAPPSSQPAAAPAAAPYVPSAANADALALQRAPIEGQWHADSGEDTFDAIFSTASEQNALHITCYAGKSITLAVGPAPQATTLRLITSTRTLALSLHGATARIPRGAPEHDALIATLGTPGDRFAIDAGGVLTVFPWNDALATTLHACR